LNFQQGTLALPDYIQLMRRAYVHQCGKQSHGLRWQRRRGGVATLLWADSLASSSQSQKETLLGTGSQSTVIKQVRGHLLGHLSCSAHTWQDLQQLRMATTCTLHDVFAPGFKIGKYNHLHEVVNPDTMNRCGSPFQRVTNWSY